ncbi:hypothetical protein EUGRSUZ_C02974 [Eucalyptus grandis]|uniref:Uncharacterized protein n=2 Tax=Eucalyptus grandis TaxID=71139 RepID=A0ACC3LHR5_EUCGR|nr:hypothetical protein EUGRSUZ_C02974 [Eucalyptus grandis]
MPTQRKNDKSFLPKNKIKGCSCRNNQNLQIEISLKGFSRRKGGAKSEHHDECSHQSVEFSLSTDIFPSWMASPHNQ